MRLEYLEDRTLLSAVVAATTNDLINDIIAANQGTGPTTIQLQAADAANGFNFTSVYSSTNDALPQITADITITGTSGFDNTIQRSTAAGTPSFRLFEVLGGGSLSLQNLTLTGGLAQGTGTAAEGGAVYSSGGLTLSGVTVQGNKAQGINGVAVSAGATGTPGTDASGGGLYMAGGTLSLSNDTITGNSAIGGHGGGILFVSQAHLGGDGGAGYGGGLYVAGGSVTLNDNTISGNYAIGGSGGGYGPQGGTGGAGSGGGLYVAAGNLSMSGDAITGNNAVGGVGGPGGSESAAHGYFIGNHGTGGAGSGGGLYVATNAVTLSLTNETISNNKAAGGNGGEGMFRAQAPGGQGYDTGGKGGTGQGGGLYVAGGNVTLSEDQLAGNAADGGKGGIAFPGLTFGGSGGAGGTGFGGGLYAAGGSVTLNNDTLSGNLASGGTGAGGAGAGAATPGEVFGGYGGLGGAGLGGGAYVADGVITLSGGAITGNHAFGALGGYKSVSYGPGANGGDGSGGGIDVAGGAVTLAGVGLNGNIAAGGPAGRPAPGTNQTFSTGGGSATGGGLFVSPGVTVLGDSATSFSSDSVYGGAPGGTTSFPDLAANSPGFGNYTVNVTSAPTVTVTDGGTYNGNTHNAVGSAVGTDGHTPVSGSFSYTYYASDGVTQLSGAPTSAGSYYVTAAFTSGDPNYGNATSAETSFTIGKADSTITVTPSVNPSVYGQNVTLTANVASTTSGTPTGTVAFYSGNTFLGRGPLNAAGQATFATTGLAVGNDTVQAVYDDVTDPGATLDSNFLTSSNSFVQTVNADVTTRVAVSRSGLVANRRTGTYAGTIGITNTSQAAISGGLIFDWKGLATGVSVQSVSVVINGVTTALTVTSDGQGGSQVVISSSLLAQLAVGQTITLNVIYADPTFAAVNFLPELFSNPTL